MEREREREKEREREQERERGREGGKSEFCHLHMKLCRYCFNTTEVISLSRLRMFICGMLLNGLLDYIHDITNCFLSLSRI